MSRDETFCPLLSHHIAVYIPRCSNMALCLPCSSLLVRAHRAQLAGRGSRSYRPRRCQAANKPEPAPPAAPASTSTVDSPIAALTQRLLAASSPGDSRMLLLAAALVGVAALAAPQPALADNHYHHTAQLLADVAEGEDFWSNVLRYISYFFSVLLGTAYVAVKPLVELFKRPTTAVLALGAIAGLVAFVSFTVKAMLGVSDAGFEYTY